jgi:hypothetical protein
VHDDRLFGAGRHEDLHCIVVIADGTLIERTLNAAGLRPIPKPVKTLAAAAARRALTFISGHLRRD